MADSISSRAQARDPSELLVKMVGIREPTFEGDFLHRQLGGEQKQSGGLDTVME